MMLKKKNSLTYHFIVITFKIQIHPKKKKHSMKVKGQKSFICMQFQIVTFAADAMLHVIAIAMS